MTSEHLSDQCYDADHGFCNGKCQADGCDEPCSCPCHVKAIDRQDVPQEDQFL